MSIIRIIDYMNTPRERVELFHLLFLDQLSRNLDPKLYAVKGGCNLRFFFKSIRYSEDLDIDVQTVAVNTLENKVNRILHAISFQSILKTHHIQLDTLSTPKQTNTTQRWKLTLRTESLLMLNTKIEFSRRGIEHQTVYEPITPEIIHQHHLTPILCPHYNKQSAFIQKIVALAGRPQTQARDIFDLYWLINMGDIPLATDLIKQEQIEQAQNNALSISFADFKSQVVAFLSIDYQRQYDTSILWESIVSTVIEKLELFKL